MVPIYESKRMTVGHWELPVYVFTILNLGEDNSLYSEIYLPFAV